MPDGRDISRRDFFQSLIRKLSEKAADKVARAVDLPLPDGPPLAVVDNSLCLMGQGKACDDCVKACPVSPKAITVSAVGLSAGVNASLCTGCGDCILICPAKAITSKPRR